MTFDYDAFYAENPNGLGPPTQAIVDAFARLPGPPLRVLDVGCGQGRDALFLARQGHSVVGVDLSPAGVGDMRRAAKAEGLGIVGFVADVATFVPDGLFDVLLIDRTLHMLDAPQRYAVLGRLLPSVRPGGDLLLADEASNMPGFRAVLAQSGRAWRGHPTRAKGHLFVTEDL